MTAAPRRTTNPMQTMKLNSILTAAALFGISLNLAMAQRPGGRGGKGGAGGPPGGEGERPPATEIAKHLSERYTALATYDTDKDGKLSDKEKAAVAKAIDDGTLEFGPPGGGQGGPPPGADRPSGKRIAERAAKLFEQIAAYDGDKDGKIDDKEQAALVKAIEDGTLKLQPPGGRGPGGRGGEDAPPPLRL